MSEQPQAQQNAALENDRPDRNPDWPIWTTAYLQALTEVPNLSRAAEHAGVHRTTAERLRKRDEAFRLAVYDAREKALDRLEEVIYASATTGLPARKTVTTTKTRRGENGEQIVETTSQEVDELVRNPTLAMFYLKRWRPEYRETFKVEQTGAGGGPIRHEVAVVEDEAVRDFYAALDELTPA